MENEIKLTFLAGVQVDNEIFFSAWNRNGLFKYNPMTEQCKFLKFFADEENIGLHSQAILYKDTIWFIPRASERITIVELSNMNFTYLELPECGHRSEGHIPHIRMEGYIKKNEKYLWLIPYAYKLFLKIDMDKREIIKVEEWCQEGYAISIGVWVQNKLCVYVNSCNELRILDVVSDRQSIKKIGEKGVSYMGIQKIGKWILIFPKWLKDGILSLNTNTDEMRITKLECSEQCYYEYQVLTKEEDIFLIPYMGNKQVRIGVEEGSCFIKEIKKLEIENNIYCAKKIIYDNEIWFLPLVENNPIICYEKQEDTIQYRDIKIYKKNYSEDIIQSVRKYGIEYSPLACSQVIKEYTQFLNAFLQFLKKESRNNRIATSVNIGENIYKLLE